MICSQLEMCPMDLVPQERGQPMWRRVGVESLADMERILEEIPAEMVNYGYSETDCFHVCLSLEEAIINAHKHGNQRDWSKAIIVRYFVGADGVVAQVDDKGPGFDPDLVPDPLAPENLERPSGPGLLLMRSFLSAICHNERGNRICLCKRRSSSP